MDKVFMFRSPLEMLVYILLSMVLFVAGIVVGRCKLRRIRWWHFALLCVVGICLSIQGWWFLRGIQ